MNKRKLWWSRRRKDFKIDWYNGKKGGQNVNKHANCCRITDLQTGIVAHCEEHKSQTQNKKVALKRMVKKLQDYYESLEPQSERKLDNGFSGKNTRTYNECEDRVVDHVTGEKYSYKMTVGKGDISDIIEERMVKVIEDDKF